MGVQDFVQRHTIPFAFFLGHRQRNFGNSDPRVHKENAENAAQGDSEGGRDKKNIFQLKKIRIWEK